MGAFLALVGFLGFIVFIVLAIVGVIRKNGKAKKRLLFAGVSFVLVIIGAIMTSTSDTASTETEDNKEKTEEVAKTEDVEKKDEKTEEEIAAEKEAEKKADEEAKKKKAEEDKKEKEEEAKEQALLAQKKYANLASIMIPALHEGLELQDVTYDFISQNSKLFPAFTPEDVKKAKDITDSSISSKHLNKNATPYLNKMATFSGTVISVEENTEGEDTTTLIHIMDDDYQSYQILMYKSSGDILEDDNIRFWGVPVGPASFDNVSGGTTNVQFFVGAHAEKQ